MFLYIAIAIVNLCSEFSFFYMYYTLQAKRFHIAKMMLLIVVPTIITLFISPLPKFLLAHFGISTLLTAHVINLALNLLFLIAVGERDIKKTAFYTLFSYMLWFIFSLGFAGLLDFCASRWNPSVYFSYLLNILFSFLLAWVMSKAIPKYDLCRITAYLQSQIDTWPKTIVLYPAFLFFTTIMDSVRSEDVAYSITLFLTCMVVLFVLLAVMRSTSARINMEDKERAQQTVIDQQSLYIQSLEEIHQNTRRLRHDYKNMITSLYLQSKEGNLQEIEDAMGKILEDFDMDIGRKMNLTNQLANIQVMELKSLLLNKITIINRLHIGFRFEVLYPVDDLIIPKMDLVRALGILLDNAMEEVSGNGGDISLMILREERLLTFVVDNSLHHEVSMAELYREGYTTKGEGRGLGLSSYRKLIDKYSNVSSQTVIQKGRLIQELQIEVK
ncbi:GHKL domain-containing protein [Emergencia timonensis]|uniref:sensor histidine kinase n=1 Tax=Emergencia timonensis TaxID=1776384 RepID=UPI001D0609E7|nr:GHKL domain-containing protein [Emergencia timonensis]MBS6176053.1 GHKL domain-containing protein [Clostridiales bacterium]MCB6475505.1 GHKL domain-containing protein [Emergencia timonensis]